MRYISQSMLMLIGLTLSTTASSAVNDIFPADFIPLAPETYVATTYLFNKHAEGPYLSGNKISDWSVKSLSAIFRLTKFKDWNGTVVAGSFVAGLTQQELGGSDIPNSLNRQASGPRDIRFNGTAWLINNPISREYLAFNATWLLPTGQYDAGNIQNIGENRHQLAFSFAWIKGIGQQCNFELIGEVAGYSTNTTYYPGQVKQSKEPTHAVTSYLRYNLGKGIEGYYGHEWNSGGGTFQNGASQHDSPNHERSMVGIIYPVNLTNILNLRISRDLHVTNGFGTNREISVRWLNFF